LAPSAAALLAPSIALAGVSLGDKLSNTDEGITASLEAAGYSVLEIEREHDEIEVEALLDGTQHEIEIEPDTGLVIGMEIDDDNDDDDDDDDDNDDSGNEDDAENSAAQ